MRERRKKRGEHNIWVLVFGKKQIKGNKLVATKVRIQ
jgi:hypothetical protein